MTNKKTYAELEDKCKELKVVLSIVAIVLLFIFILLWVTDANLKSQLQECQENVPTWNLIIRCDYDWEEFEELSYTLVLNNHTKYLELLEELKDDEWCEVLK